MRVAVLTGGASAEREVSLATGVQVAGALREAGHEVVAVDTVEGPLGTAGEERVARAGVGRVPPPPGAGKRLDARRIVELARLPEVERSDVVFVALHGGSGEDGTLQALLDLLGVRYTGSGHLGCALAMDKEVSKRLFREAGVPTPAWRAGPFGPEALEELGCPLVVKPASGGSTVGLSVVREPGELGEARELALRYDRAALAERYVEGREFTVGVVDGEALPVGEIVPAHEIFDYECKYQPEMAEEIFPADLPDPRAVRLQDLALAACRALRLRDYGRIDFLLDDEGEAWCLEANALPGLTANSLVPKAAAAAGVTFPRLCERIVRTAARR